MADSMDFGNGTYFDRPANKGAVNGHETRDYNEYLRMGGPSLDSPQANSGGGSNGAISDALYANYNTFLQREKDFAKNNPWNMDQVLKEEAAKVKERLDPYYNKTLGDYLQGVAVKSARSLEDERNLLGQLSQTTDRYNQQQKDMLKGSLDQIDQGNATSDLGSSGIGARQEGAAAADAQTGIDQYNQVASNTARQTKIAGERLRGYDLPTAVNLEKNSLGAEQTANEYSQTYAQAQQRQNQYQFNQQAYAGDNPGSSNTNFQTDLYSILGKPSVQT